MRFKSLYETIAVLSAALATQISSAAPIVWTGTSGTDLLWATPGNWSPTTPPTSADDAQFFDQGAALDLSAPNNIVSANRTVQSLWFGQTNGFQYSLLNPGVTLTLSGTNTGNIFVAGTETDNGATQGETNVISGPGATFVINNTNAAFVVRQESANGGSSLRSTLDLSTLDNFSADVSRVLVGVEGLLPRPAGTLYLAKTNVITAVGSQPAIGIGGNGGGNHNSGNSSYVWLGQQNVINANSITVGRVKQTGNSSITFNTNVFSDPVAVFRGADGVSRVADWRLGDAESGSGSGDTAGICDFTGGTVDALVDSMTLGRQVGGHNPIGRLTLDRGTFDVNTLTLGLQTASGINNATGIVNVNGTGTLIVNSNLVFGQVAGGTGAPTTGGSLNINGGTVDVRGAITIGGVARVNVTNGLLNLPTNSTLSLDTLVVDGGTISNATTISATNQSVTSLSILNGGKIPNAVSFDLGTGGNAQWFPGDTLVVSNSLKGSGFIFADVQAQGATLSPGADGIPGTLSITPFTAPGNLTLNGGKLMFDLPGVSGALSDNIQVGGALTLNGTTDVEINALDGGLDTTTPYTLINYASLVGDASGLHVSGPLSQSRYTFTFITANANALQLSVGGAGAANLIWKGDGSANIWDLKGANNWLNGASANQFFNLDSVVFDDSGSATPSVNLVGALVPGSITLSNATKSYTFSGAGNFEGGNLTNFSSSTVTISNDNTNNLNFVDLETGTLVLAGNSANNFKSVSINPPATLKISNSNANTFGPGGIVLNGGTLTLDQSADSTLDATISNFGTITKINTNTLTLLGDNSSLSAPINVNSGTLQSGAGSGPFGTGGLIINSGGALNVNSQNIGAVTVTAIGSGPDGSGAIVNRGVDQTAALRTVVLAGNTTFGGTARWDIRNSGGSASLNTGGNGYNITKVGTNQVALVGVIVDPMLGDVDIQEGSFGIQTTTVSASAGFGDATKTITVHSGATLETWGLGASTPLPKQITLQDGASVQNDSGVTVISGNVSLLGNAFFNAGGTSLTFSGTLSGAGGVTSGGAAITELAGVNNYTGSTTVTNGTLEIDGSIAGSGATVNGGTLAGIGAINAPVVVNSGGTLSPGTNGIGTLSIVGNLSLAGTTTMDLDKTSGVLTSDVVTNVAALTLGGALNLNLTGEPLADGDFFNLFSATSITGTFASITPATPGAGLQWDKSRLPSGILKVVTGAQVPAIGGIAISGGQAVVSGTGGVANGPYHILASTNLALPISSWTSLGASSFDASGNFSFTNAIDPTAPQRFYIIQVP